MHRTIFALLVACVFLGCAGTGAQITAGTAQLLGTVVKRVDEIYTPQYKKHAQDVYTGAQFKAIKQKDGAQAALNFYEVQMRPWDISVQAIKGARAAVFALGTAAESTRQADKTVRIVETLARSTAAVIGAVQAVAQLPGVRIPPELIAVLGHSCTFVSALTASAKLSADAVPSACTGILNTGLLGVPERPADVPAPVPVPVPIPVPVPAVAAPAAPVPAGPAPDPAAPVPAPQPVPTPVPAAQP